MFLLDVQSSRWHKLSDAVECTDLSWSADSQYLYTNLGGPNARIVRIGVVHGDWGAAADLRFQSIYNLAEVQELGFSVAPDDA